MNQRHILVIGGVAGGASAAARLRRLDESCRITVVDRGPHVSFANCGLPYHVGGVIAEESKLVVASPELFRDRFAIEVRTGTEAVSIDRAGRSVTLRDVASGAETVEAYDALVLAPGAAPVRPPLPGLDLPGIFIVRSIPDTRKIRAWIAERSPTRALVVGGGFIGLEMAENLAHRGLEVTILEKLGQVMPPLDPEMATPVAERLRAKGVDLRLGEGLARIEQTAAGLVAHTDRGTIETDLVILAIGVRPETQLAQAAGLAVGPRGGILVDGAMRTSDPAIWAVGDAVESRDVVTGQEVVLPLAGPANRQGRLAAEAIAGRAPRFRGVQATAVVGLFGLVAASTGASEKGLRRAGVTGFATVQLHPGHHAGYYPGARPIHLKLIFDSRSGRILGAQAVGEEGVEKRIDVIAMAIQMGGTVRDLAEAELCYAPQFGGAKDPVNVAGMMACNVLDGDMPLADWDEAARGGIPVVDVREPHEFAAGHVPGAINLPLTQLRARHGELPMDRPIALCCGVGQRAYYGVRFLNQRGFQARNLSGGHTTWKHRVAAGMHPVH